MEAVSQFSNNMQNGEANLMFGNEKTYGLPIFWELAMDKT